MSIEDTVVELTALTEITVNLAFAPPPVTVSVSPTLYPVPAVSMAIPVTPPPETVVSTNIPLPVPPVVTTSLSAVYPLPPTVIETELTPPLTVAVAAVVWSRPMLVSVHTIEQVSPPLPALMLVILRVPVP